MSATARNIAIILVLAALVAFLPGGGTGADAVIAAVKLAFYASLGWFASIMYRQHRTTLYSLGDRHRALLYIAVAAGALTLTATKRLWSTSPGELAWLALIAGCAYALFLVFRAARQY